MTTTTNPTPTPPASRYDFAFVGSGRAVYRSRDPELLVSGPAGTGKSRSVLEKIFHLAEVRYPGMRALIVRKTRVSLTETALFTWEQFVLPPWHACHPDRGGAHRAHRQSYQFPNGSEVVVGGMDKPEKIMSSEYDVIYPQEAIELTEDDWESLTTRLRNRRTPFQQIVGDTNPSHPRHWLKRRCDEGRCRLIATRHEDNPVLYDRSAKQWTEFGRTYLARLDALTGARKLRLRWGRWVQAEGTVYEEWDAGVHVVTPFPVPADWQHYLSVDFGFTNPFVCQLWARDGDGRLYLRREVYRTKTLVEDHAKAIKAMLAACGSPKVQAVVCDHDAEDRATLERHLGLPTRPADKAVTAGIQELAERLKVQPDGRPRLAVFRDAVWERDPALVEASKPWCTEHEMDAYVWDQAKAVKECPLKQDDHGCDAARYLAKYLGRRAGLAVGFVRT